MFRGLLVGALAEFNDQSSQFLVVIKALEHLVRFPATLTDDEQPRRLIAQLLRKFRPDIQKQQVVLPCFYCAEADERPMDRSLAKGPGLRRVYSEFGCKGGRHAQSLGACKTGEF